MSNYCRREDEPLSEPGVLTTCSVESTYVPEISPEKPKYTITRGKEPNVTYTIQDVNKLRRKTSSPYDKWKNDILYGGNTNTHLSRKIGGIKLNVNTVDMEKETSQSYKLLVDKTFRNNGGTPYKKHREGIDKSFTPSKAKRNKNRRNKVKHKHN